MSNDNNILQQVLLIRWLSLASAAGAACSAAISLWLNQSTLLIFSIISSLLCMFFVASLWQRYRFQVEQQQTSAHDVELHQQEVNELQGALEKHKNFESELKKSKLEAESATMAKSEFLATMSHEIRTPLNGIIPMLDILASTHLEHDQAEILSTARSSAHQMKQIVDDILDYSKLEANKLQLETTGLNVREVVTSIVQMFSSQADAKRLAILVNLDPSLRLAVRGDPVRLRQILSNILSNAIKFTDKGSIQISVRTLSETRHHHLMRFEIKDSGIGISKESADRLFKPFSQADTSTTRLYGGTGLGLVICKRIVDLMGGNIGVNSQANAGSTFWFEIPMLKAMGDSQGMASELKNASVLLYSSDPILTKKIEQANSSAGAKLSVANTVFEAQKILADSVVGSSSDLDLIIVDASSGRQSAIQMQKTAISNKEFERARIVILHNNESAQLELLQSARSRVFSRNTETLLLFSEINKMLNATASNQGSVQRMDQQPQVNIQVEEVFHATHNRGMVLLVEDNPVNQLVAQRLIKMNNFEYVSVENGAFALEVLQNQSFDMVLMDCQMPVMDGYKATAAWREFEKKNNLPRMPIIAMTANAMAEDRQKCMDAGMDDYVSKPVDRKLLQKVMNKWLAVGKQFTTISPVAVQANGVHEAIAPVVENNTVRTSVLDMEIITDLQDMMGNDYQGLIRIYLEDSPKLIAQLHSAHTNNDIQAMIPPAHTLKSSSANLGAVQLSDYAKNIEHTSRSGQGVTTREEIAQLIAEFERVQLALNALIN